MKRPDILKYVLQNIDIEGCEKNSLLPHHCNPQCVCYRKLSFFLKPKMNVQKQTYFIQFY